MTGDIFSEWAQQVMFGALLPFASPLLSSERIYAAYLLSALVCAYFSYRYYTKGTPFDVRKFFATIAPKKDYVHPSAIVDYVLFALNPALVVSVLILPSLLSSMGWGEMVGAALNAVLGAGTFFDPSSGVAVALFTLVAFIAYDFGQFIIHYALHRIPLLWEFHKIHHSAQVLTPITAYRFHPVELLLTSLSVAFFSGLAQGAFIWLYGHPPEVIRVAGLHVGIFLFYVMAYNLRHSNVWLSYPRALSHLLISPSQHQIHHSIAPQHWDKNMGYMLSIWDWMFGTLYVPEGRETLQFGLDGREELAYNRIGAAYALPFVRVWARIRGKSLTALGLALLALSLTPAPARAEPPRSLWLEELTSPEIAAAIKDGYTQVLVPTAGIEQNGPQMPLNKHARVLRYTAPRIAEALGHTLIAPVVDHVPEGSIWPKLGHMRFAGTISMPEDVFEEMLEATGRSLHAHGFTAIYFIGDSGDNQDGQEEAAESLREDDIPAYHVGEYYANKAQEEWLATKGFGKDAIGGHAGLRDTSELLAAAGDAVRRDKLRDYPKDAMAQNGNWGRTDLATAELGDTLLRIKIDRAVAAIQGLQK
ncbi:MAG: creatininase family protein [Alphaproteobacteria bacterium]|nr:creatininase family protein [Alphaproteobacteria bacterium]